MATAFLKRPMRFLHLEDNANDQLLVREMLHGDGLLGEMTVVSTSSDFENALHREPFDLIISDFSLPSFDGLKALAIARQITPQTPFIFFSGTIGEEVAVESLRNGATDYVLKQRPQRLVGAVRNALRMKEERSRVTRIEGELHQMEERLRIVARASNDVVWEWDIPRNKLWFSENFQDVFGYSREEIGSSLVRWQSLIHPEDRDRVVAGLTAAVAAGGRVWWSEHRVRRDSGAYLDIYDRASIIYGNGRKPVRVVGMAIDMTERKKSEEKIREQAELLDKAQDAIIVCNLDRSIVYWNKGAERIYGWSAGEALGKNVRQLFFRERLPTEACKSLEENGEWMGELSEFTKNNLSVVVQARATLIRDERGVGKSLLIINTDITERKQLEEQFLRAQRLESLGALVGGIAHDLNNALVPIMVGVDILRMQPLSPDAESMVRTMESSARRSSEMVQQMLVFARGGEKDKTIIHANQLVKEMAKIIADTFPKSIRCRMQVDKNLWPVSGFPTQLHQILLNLCVNARDAMPDGGTLTLTGENVNLPRQEAERYKMAPGNFVCLSVADTGTGMSAEVREKLFQPFFTTKGKKGTGLGLSTCQNIAKSHNGFITLQSKPGAGTRFEVYLPASEESSVKSALTPKPLPPSGRGERILVVDDEEAILAITRAALDNYGYEVLVARSGSEAINYFAENRPPVSLLITDWAMPLMDGATAVKAIRKIQPDLKVIFMSGSEGGVEALIPKVKMDAFIPKPFTNETLLETVHNVLLKK
ncbi:MAG TPA: response regulator [Verrucomicrobiae bacterium]|jgi:PAS domain S-box-containing protein